MFQLELESFAFHNHKKLCLLLIRTNRAVVMTETEENLVFGLSYFVVYLLTYMYFVFHFGILIQMEYLQLKNRKVLKSHNQALRQSIEMSKVKLNWQTASAELLISLKEIWANDGFSNVTLTFEDGAVIQTNRTLIAALSPVMRNFLEGKESQNSKIFMFGIDSSTMKALLDFVFTEEICIEQEKLDLFLSTATKLKVCGFMDDNKENLTEKSDNEYPQYDSKQEILCPTINELTSFDSAVFERELEVDLNAHSEETVQKNRSDLLDSEDNTQNFDARLKVEEEIADKKKGISCFICKAAGKLDHDRFPSIDDLNQHEKEVHTRDNSPVYNCDQCGLEFHKLVVFNQHKRKEHPDNTSRGMVACDVCGRSYKTKAKMEKHRDFSHPIPGTLFKCKMPNCPKESTTKNASNVHYYQAHSERQRKEFEGKLITM